MTQTEFFGGGLFEGGLFEEEAYSRRGLISKLVFSSKVDIKTK